MYASCASQTSALLALCVLSTTLRLLSTQVSVLRSVPFPPTLQLASQVSVLQTSLPRPECTCFLSLFLSNPAPLKLHLCNSHCSPSSHKVNLYYWASALVRTVAHHSYSQLSLLILQANGRDIGYSDSTVDNGVPVMFHYS